MNDEDQQHIFSREMEKRMNQLTDELDIDYMFMLGWFQRMTWRIQQELDLAEMEEIMRRESGEDEP